MASDYLQALTSRAQISMVEIKFLESLFVNSSDEIHALLSPLVASDSRSLDPVKAAESMGVRLAHLVQLVESEISVAYRAKLKRDNNSVTARKAGVLREPWVGALAAAPTCPNSPSSVNTLNASLSVDLEHWRAVDQGEPGTCVAFGVAACVEHLVAKPGKALPDMSEQFLYWAIKNHSADIQPMEYRTKLAFASQALAGDGICHETSWQYNPIPAIPGQSVGGKQPDISAKTDASKFKINATYYCDRPGINKPVPDAAAKIWNLINDAKRPVAICLPIYSKPGQPEIDNWRNNGLAEAYGIVADPKTSVYLEESGSHCICITGFHPGTTGRPGKKFIFRNSWGTDWSAQTGLGSPYSYIPRPGYGAISVEYVNEYCWELLQL